MSNSQAFSAAIEVLEKGLRDDAPDEAAAEPTASPAPESELPLSPLPLEPTGDWGMA